MAGWRRWFRDGKEVREPDAAGRKLNEIVRLLQGDLGTEVRWHVHEPNVAALFAVALTLNECQTPIILRFNSGGWFEERHESVRSAVARINDLVTRGDRFLQSRVFVEEMSPDLGRMPHVLKDAWLGSGAAEDFAIKCFFDPQSESFIVNHVGPKSPIGRVWGTNPTSAPCRNSGAFGVSANHSYLRATQQGRRIYEHVIAAFSFPDNALRWVPYHRIILPQNEAGMIDSVVVVAECADVDFKVL